MPLKKELSNVKWDKMRYLIKGGLESAIHVE